MDESVLLYAEVDESSESRDIVDDARKLHAYGERIEAIHAGHESIAVVVGARVAPRFAELSNNVGHGLDAAHALRRKRLDVNAIEQLGIGRKVGGFHLKRIGHALHDVVAFGMNASIVELFLATGHAEETGGEFESLVAEAWHFLQLGATREVAIGGTVSHDVGGERRADARDVGEEFFGGRVYVDAHGIDAAHHRIVEGILKFTLIHIVLILPNAY